jgi:nitrate/nitrite transporter NarK
MYNFLSNNNVDANGCPDAIGHLKHTALYFILSFIVMVVLNFFKASEKKKTIGLLIKYAFYSTLMFYLVSNKEMYQLMNNIIGNTVADSTGCPSKYGVFIHGLVFLILKFLVMYLPKDTPFVKISTMELSGLIN